MAAKKSTNPAHPVMRLNEQERDAYLDVARTANFEVHQLAKFLRESMKASIGTDCEHALRGICVRLMQLSDIVYESFLADDELTELSELQRRLGLDEARHA